MRTFEELLEKAEKMHGGHACAGIVLGVRLTMLACRTLGIDDPEADAKRLIVFVEIDRCATDAIAAVTGCRLGKRTLKHVDYGKMAATFLDTRTGLAVRVVARDDSRARAHDYVPAVVPAAEVQREAYKVMPDDALFIVQHVELQLRPQDRPGAPIRNATCQRCGERINDCREVYAGGEVLCQACANGPYYVIAPGEPTLKQVTVAANEVIPA